MWLCVAQSPVLGRQRWEDPGGRGAGPPSNCCTGETYLCCVFQTHKWTSPHSYLKMRLSSPFCVTWSHYSKEHLCQFPEGKDDWKQVLPLFFSGSIHKSRNAGNFRRRPSWEQAASYRQNRVLRNTPSPHANPTLTHCIGADVWACPSLCLGWCIRDPSPALTAWSICSVGGFCLAVAEFLPLPPLKRSLKPNLLHTPHLSTCKVK